MIYAEIKITALEDKENIEIYSLEFFWAESYLKELLPWQDHLANLRNDKVYESSFLQEWSEYLVNKRIILNYLADKKYIPCGDHIFYKKSFFDKFL